MFFRVLFAVACVCQSTALTTLPNLWETRIIPIRNSDILTVSTKYDLDVEAQILDSKFHALESETVFDDGVRASYSLFPDAARLDSGHFIVVWNSVPDPVSGKEVTLGQLLSNNLQKTKGLFKVGEQEDYRLRPRVAALTDGFVVVWGFKNEHTAGIAFQMFNSEAQAIGKDEVVVEISRAKLSASLSATTAGIVPSVTVNSDKSEFVVVWQVDKSIQGRTYSCSGVAATDVFDVIKNAESARTLSVCAMPGEYLVSWSSNGTALVQGFDSKGTLMGGETTVSKKQSDANTAVVCMPGVGFAVSFLASFEAEKGIYIRFFDTQHMQKSSDLFVGKTDSFGDHSSVLNSEGEIVTVWASHVLEPIHPSSHLAKAVIPVISGVDHSDKLKTEHEVSVNFSNWFYVCLTFCMVLGGWKLGILDSPLFICNVKIQCSHAA